MIYLDNAATTWPKPPQVTEAMQATITDIGANPGRGGYDLSIRAGQKLYTTREKVAQLFGMTDPLKVVFTANATVALNMVLMGLLNQGNHVITSSLEHNSVARPLHLLAKGKIDYTVIRTDPEVGLDLSEVEKSIRTNTRLMVFTHGSNVFGTVLPIEQLTALAHRYGIAILVDASQTAGLYPLDLGNMPIDFLVASGHKGLYGPQGIGILCVNGKNNLRPLFVGGTGSSSETLDHPTLMPDALECGTPNTPGIAGLEAGIDYVISTGIINIRQHEEQLITSLYRALNTIPAVKIYGPRLGESRTSVLSFNIGSTGSTTVAHLLNRRYGIAIRAGLHCAAWAHETAGTVEQGTVRASVGFFNSISDIEILAQAVEELASELK